MTHDFLGNTLRVLVSTFDVKGDSGIVLGTPVDVRACPQALCGMEDIEPTRTDEVLTATGFLLGMLVDVRGDPHIVLTTL